VDISSVIDKKKEAIFTYKKSLLDIPELFWQAIEGLNTFRSLLFKRKGMYEAFWVIDTPLSMGEIVKWATFDYLDSTSEETAETFLSQVKVADSLLFELRNALRTSDAKEAEIRTLKSTLEEIERRLMGQKTEKMEFDLIKQSLAWRLIGRFYSFRDKVLPNGTTRRNLYNKATEKFKKVI